MANLKDKSMDQIREAIIGVQGNGSDDFEKLIMCVYHWFNAQELEAFTEFVQTEQE